MTKQKFKLNKEESKFVQSFVNLGVKRGHFEVSIKEGTLLRRNSVQRHCLSRAKAIQVKLRDTLHEPICSPAVRLPPICGQRIPAN